MNLESLLYGPGLYGATGALTIFLGLYGLILRPNAVRKIVAVNVVGSGVFLLFGAVADRAAPGPGGDPVPHAMVITGIVVALSATALAAALVLRLSRDTGLIVLPPEPADMLEQESRDAVRAAGDHAASPLGSP